MNLTKELLEQIVDFSFDWYPEGQIDWDDLLYRIEVNFNLDLGNDMLSPEIKKIKAAINKARREAE